MGVFGMCDSCAWRYCGVPDPSCSICLGTGRIDGGDIEGVDPLVVLRAARMATGEGVPRIRLCEAKLLGEPGSGTLADPPQDMGARSAIGRAAGQLLRDLGLRKAKPRKVLTTEERAERRRELAARKERDRLLVAGLKGQQQKRADDRQRRLIETRAAQAIAEMHPDEFEQEKEAQEVFVALENGLPDPSVGLHRSARR